MKLLPLVALLIATAALVACGGTSSSRTGAQLRADATAAVLRAQADGVQLVEAAREADEQARRATDAVINATSTQRAIDARATAAQRSQDATATVLARPTATATSTSMPTATATPLPTFTSTATVEPSATERVVVATATVEVKAVAPTQTNENVTGFITLLLVSTAILIALAYVGQRWLTK